MKLEKNARGWLVEPSTSDEQVSLNFLLNALVETYGTCVKSEDSSPTTRSLSLDHIPSKVTSD